MINLVVLCKDTFSATPYVEGLRDENSRFGSLIFTPILLVFRQVFKEIVSERLPDAGQQGGIETFALENLVHIRAVAADFPCEPGWRAFLAGQFELDEVAEVEHEKRRNRLRLSSSEAPPSAFANR